MRVKITAQAEIDIEDIFEYIALDSPVQADRFIDELLEECDKIGLMPFGYPVVRRYQTVDIRRKVYGRYHIFYRIMGDAQVHVLHVFQGARDFDPLLDDELGGDYPA